MNLSINYQSKNKTQNNTSFKALHMDEEKIAKELGYYAGKLAQKMRPELEKYSRNVDIYIVPQKDNANRVNNKLTVCVRNTFRRIVDGKDTLVSSSSPRIGICSGNGGFSHNYFVKVTKDLKRDLLHENYEASTGKTYTKKHFSLRSLFRRRFSNAVVRLRQRFGSKDCAVQ